MSFLSLSFCNLHLLIYISALAQYISNISFHSLPWLSFPDNRSLFPPRLRLSGVVLSWEIGKRVAKCWVLARTATAWASYCTSLVTRWASGTSTCGQTGTITWMYCTRIFRKVRDYAKSWFDWIYYWALVNTKLVTSFPWNMIVFTKFIYYIEWNQYMWKDYLYIS